MTAALPVDRMRLDQPLPRLGAVGAGIHPERATNRAGDAVEEGEAAEAFVAGEGREALVGQRGARPDRVALADRVAEAFGRQADDDAGNAAVTDEQVRADADDMDRNCRIEPRQEQREVIRVCRLEQMLRPPPDPEPGERRNLGVRGEPAADVRGVEVRWSPSPSARLGQFPRQRIGPLG